MYNIKSFNNGISIDWQDIYWGIKENVLDCETAFIYADQYIENNPTIDEPSIINLLILDEKNKENTLNIILQIMNTQKIKNSSKNKSLRKIRYCILSEINGKNIDHELLLESIETVYCDFDYPKDMENFISYMPIRETDYDVTKHSKKENQQYLINNFNVFLKKECEELKINEL